MPVKLFFGRETFAYYSHRRPRRLIIFVHGFSGTSVGTWKEFNEIVHSDAALIDADIIFYGYDSLGTPASENASFFYSFLALHTTPQNTIINKHRGTDSKFEYGKIIFIAHSLGSIVTRFALISAVGDKRGWAKKSRMILFAPAHHGSKVLSSAISLMPTIAKIFVGAIALYQVKALHDLNENSKTITNLLETTKEKLRSESPEYLECFKAFRVVWAKGDSVVNNIQFCDDNPPKVVENTTHKKVCKPHRSSNYHTPHQMLMESI